MMLRDAGLGTKVETGGTMAARILSADSQARLRSVPAPTDEQSRHGSRWLAEHAIESRHCDATARDSRWQRQYLILTDTSNGAARA